MRRLVAANLLVALLTSWIALVAGIALPAVPCPMHHAGTAGHAPGASSTQAGHSGHANHDHSSHHTAARGCNCPGECGRTGATFSLPAVDNSSDTYPSAAANLLTNTGTPARAVDRLLPLSTGPPTRLRS
jgi:hypothetical protein